MKLFGQPDEPGFDQVSFAAREGEAPSFWTRRQFEQLPLIDRVRMLASGELRFYRGGEAVSAREAMTQL